MRIGFTGTSKGASTDQLIALHTTLKAYVGSFHHGDCVGADAEAHDIARLLGYEIVIHPPENPSRRAFKRGDAAWEPKPYLKRNHDIVNSTEWLIAIPSGPAEELRSGTWATIRWAKKLGRRLTIIYPDGSLECA